MKHTVKSENRGVVDPVTIILVAGLAIGAATLAGWRPFDVFRKKPDTVGLTVLQAKLTAAQQAEAQARAEASKAQQDKDTAIAAERQKYNDQLRSAQQSNVGAEYILGKVANPTPEVALGRSMVARTNLRFAVALGALPKDQADDIVAMMDGIIQQRDDALASLAESDRKFTELTGEHAATVKVLAEKTTELVTVQNKVETLAKETGVVQGKVTVATNQVKVIAQTLSDEKKSASSLLAAASRWLYGALILAAGFAGLWIYRNIYSVSTNTLGKVVADIRAGTDPIQALDTNINANLHASIKQASLTESTILP